MNNIKLDFFLLVFLLILSDCSSDKPDATDYIYNDKGGISATINIYELPNKKKHVKIYNIDNVLVEEYFLSKEEKVDGLRRIYDSLGVLAQTIEFENDKAHGLIESYYSDGTLKVKGYNKNGKRDSISWHFGPRGDTLMINEYENDILVYKENIADTTKNNIYVHPILSFYKEQFIIGDTVKIKIRIKEKGLDRSIEKYKLNYGLGMNHDVSLKEREYYLAYFEDETLEVSFVPTKPGEYLFYGFLSYEYDSVYDFNYDTFEKIIVFGDSLSL